MNEVRSAMPGIVARMRSSNFKNASPFEPASCAQDVSAGVLQRHVHVFREPRMRRKVSSNFCVTRFGYAYRNRTREGRPPR